MGRPASARAGGRARVKLSAAITALARPRRKCARRHTERLSGSCTEASESGPVAGATSAALRRVRTGPRRRAARSASSPRDTRRRPRPDSSAPDAAVRAERADGAASYQLRVGAVGGGRHDDGYGLSVRLQGTRRPLASHATREIGLKVEAAHGDVPADQRHRDRRRDGRNPAQTHVRRARRRRAFAHRGRATLRSSKHVSAGRPGAVAPSTLAPTHAVWLACLAPSRTLATPSACGFAVPAAKLSWPCSGTSVTGLSPRPARVRHRQRRRRLLRTPGRLHRDLHGEVGLRHPRQRDIAPDRFAQLREHLALADHLRPAACAV
jgi:hypothetical protein